MASSSSSSSSHYQNHHYYYYYYYYLLLSLLLSSLSSTTTSSSADDPTSFIYAGCSQSKFSPGSPFQLNLDSLLSSLSSSSSLSSFTNLTTSISSSSSPAFGLFQCLPDLPLPSCSSCIHSALSQLSVLCSSATSAALRLHSCLLRYSNTSFFSHPDTTLLLKTCGPSLPPATFSADITPMRDTALSQLLLQSPALTSTYRTAVSGNFQAASQCDGDLNAKACDDCMAAAAAQLRAACSDALSGDVYLGKCFARFWSNGVYSHKPSSTGDEAGKTFAIIIGLMAGVALLIVFLSFIKRASAGGK